MPAACPRDAYVPSYMRSPRETSFSRVPGGGEAAAGNAGKRFKGGAGPGSDERKYPPGKPGALDPGKPDRVLTLTLFLKQTTKYVRLSSLTLSGPLSGWKA